MKVMIVDDESLVRLSLKRALEKRNHQTFEAEDGVYALEAWATFQPDLVYLDVLMPRMSGPDLLKKLSPQLRGLTKVVLMSAFAGEYDLEKAKLLGANLFIPKPFEDIFMTISRGEELCR